MSSPFPSPFPRRAPPPLPPLPPTPLPPLPTPPPPHPPPPPPHPRPPPPAAPRPRCPPPRPFRSTGCRRSASPDRRLFFFPRRSTNRYRIIIFLILEFCSSICRNPFLS